MFDRKRLEYMYLERSLLVLKDILGCLAHGFCLVGTSIFETRVECSYVFRSSVSNNTKIFIYIFWMPFEFSKLHCLHVMRLQ